MALFYFLVVSLLFFDRNSALGIENCTRYLSQSNSSSVQSQSPNVTYDSSSTPMCPPWYQLREDGKCHRGKIVQGVVNFEVATGQTLLEGLYCMTTHGNATKRTDVIGGCLIAIRHYPPLISTYPLPCNISQLNKFMCADWNREGQLCGRCMKGFAPPVYSYSLACVNCTDYHLNWLKYIGVAFGPLTLFCLLICFFHISATSPYLHGFVFFCQIITSSPVLRLGVNSNLFDTSVNSLSTVVFSKLYVTLINIWNLDFLVVIYKPFCLHPNMTVLHTLTLNYLIALYPLVLLLVVFLLVKMHSRNVKLVVMLWKPFQAILRPCLRNLAIHTSLIESFATLFFLSAMKIQSVSVDLLTPTPLYFVNGTKSRNMYLYFARDVEYFGSEHIFYGILALFFLVMFTLLPGMLLLLYPYQCFQQFLNKIRCNSVTLKIFMDVFQGSYKDGTNNTRDYRFFSGIFFLTRFFFVTNFVLLNCSVILMVSGATITVLGFSIAILHPQRNEIHFILDCFILMILSLLIFASMGGILGHSNTFSTGISNVIIYIIVLLPLLYVSGLVGYWIIIKRRMPQSIWGFVVRTTVRLINNHSSEQESLLYRKDNTLDACT